MRGPGPLTTDVTSEPSERRHRRLLVEHRRTRHCCGKRGKDFPAEKSPKCRALAARKEKKTGRCACKVHSLISPGPLRHRQRGSVSESPNRDKSATRRFFHPADPGGAVASCSRAASMPVGLAASRSPPVYYFSLRHLFALSFFLIFVPPFFSPSRTRCRTSSVLALLCDIPFSIVSFLRSSAAHLGPPSPPCRVEHALWFVFCFLPFLYDSFHFFFSFSYLRCRLAPMRPSSRTQGPFPLMTAHMCALDTRPLSTVVKPSAPLRVSSPLLRRPRTAVL